MSFGEHTYVIKVKKYLQLSDTTVKVFFQTQNLMIIFN